MIEEEVDQSDLMFAKACKTEDCELCGKTVLPQDVFWDENTDLGYCSAEHMEEDRDIMLTRKYDVLDVLLGYE